MTDDEKLADMRAMMLELQPHQRIILSDEGNLIDSRSVHRVTQPEFREKPHGIWYGLGNSWLRYLFNYNDEVGDLLDRWAEKRLLRTTHVYELEVQPRSVKIIKSVAALERFKNKYQKGRYINWRKVAKRYAGIEISLSGVDTLPHWDLPSGVIWHGDAVRSFRLMRRWEARWVLERYDVVAA